MKHTVVFVALLIAVFASCKKKTQSNCWQCVNTTAFQKMGGTSLWYYVKDSSQQCGLDSAGAWQYAQSHGNQWYQHDTVFQLSVKCHL